jgi:hypothetical protein
MIASNKKEILTDKFAESNPNAMVILELAHEKGFQVHTEAGN